MAQDLLLAARAGAHRRQRMRDAAAALGVTVLAGLVFWFVPPVA
jgi:hypothetical protein